MSCSNTMGTVRFYRTASSLEWKDGGLPPAHSLTLASPLSKTNSSSTRAAAQYRRPINTISSNQGRLLLNMPIKPKYAAAIYTSFFFSSNSDYPLGALFFFANKFL